jgi:predicted permease
MMFNNCGNMGLPLAALAFGAPGFSAMVALFTISNLLQFTLGVWLIDHHARFGSLLRSPMVWSTVLGFACALVHPPIPAWTTVTLKLVGDALIPVMLLSLGARLIDVHWTDWRVGVIGGLVCPLTGIAMAALLTPLLGLSHFMVAEQYGQEPGKVASIVLIGNVMSVLFVPLGLVLALH